jgi:class 3 adenylate cyclase
MPTNQQAMPTKINSNWPRLIRLENNHRANNKENFQLNLLTFLREQTKLRSESVAIEKAAWDKYGATVAVLVIDSVGFSRTTESHGIVHFLTQMVQVRDLMSTVIERSSAISSAFHADNCFVYFSDPDEALRVAKEIAQAVVESKIQLNDTEDYGVSMGIGFGRLLYSQTLEGYFGDEMNLASKLGEDTAERGDILLTGSAFVALKHNETNGEKDTFKECSVSVSGLTLKYYSLI